MFNSGLSPGEPASSSSGDFAPRRRVSSGAGVRAVRGQRSGGRARRAQPSPVLDGAVPVTRRNWLALAFLLKALAADALSDPATTGLAPQRALDLAAPDHVLAAFALRAAPDLLERHGRQLTGHAALTAEILGFLSGQVPYLPTNLSAPEIARELLTVRIGGAAAEVV
jgi:hypothetical protein